MRQNNLFRAASLRRLSDPEDLDRTLTVVTTKAWIATATLAAMVAAIVVWSFEGEVPTYVKSQGILLNRDGKIFDAATLGSGVLTSILTEVGDTVEQGSIIAEIANFEATERYRSALALVEERTIAVAELKMAMAAENELIVRNVEQQRQRLEQLERNNRTSVETPIGAWKITASCSKNTSSPAPLWSAARTPMTKHNGSCSPLCASATTWKRPKSAARPNAASASPRRRRDSRRRSAKLMSSKP